nr:CP19k-like protein 1 [Megabalanus ajax]
MSSARLLLLCAAAASAVPLPSGFRPPTPTTPAPPLPSSSSESLIGIGSKLSSSIVTGGGAVVNTRGSTSGSATLHTSYKGPGESSETTTVGKTGLSETSAAASGGVSIQKNRAKTVVDSTEEGIEVKTGTEGKGITDGKAAGTQKAGAEGGAKTVDTTKFVYTDGENSFQVQHVERTAAESTSGHEASIEGFGTFGVLNFGTTITKKMRVPKVPKSPAPAPTSAPALSPEPDYWHDEPKPVTTTAAPTTVSPQELSSKSKMKQAGKTSGTGAVTASGATQGSTTSETDVKTPTGNAKQAAVANSGVSGTGVSSGESGFMHVAVGGTVVFKTKDGAKVVTTSDGFGNTKGASGTIQTVAVNGGLSVLDNIDLDLPGFNIRSKKKVSGSSSTGHEASSAGDGEFVAKNLAGTEIKLLSPELSLDEISMPTLPPTTTTVKPPKEPKFKLGKW